MEAFKLLLQNNPWLKYLLILVAGVAIGAMFYPTKHIEERYKSEYEQTIAKQAEEHRLKETSLQEKLDKSTSEKNTLQVESSKKISSLTIQVRDLKSKTKESYYKIVRPDGTIEIKKFKESEVDESSKVVTSIKEEFDTKIKQINEKYEKIHKERVVAIKEEFDKKEASYQQTIARLEKEKITDINHKSGGFEIGYLKNKSYYSHTTYDVFGPVYLGIQTEYNPTNSDFNAGAGVGIRF